MTSEKPQHMLTLTHTAMGHGWVCSCGRSGSGMAPTEFAARGYGERHVRAALKRVV